MKTFFGNLILFPNANIWHSLAIWLSAGNWHCSFGFTPFLFGKANVHEHPKINPNRTEHVRSGKPNRTVGPSLMGTSRRRERTRGVRSSVSVFRKLEIPGYFRLRIPSSVFRKEENLFRTALERTGKSMGKVSGG